MESEIIKIVKETPTNKYCCLSAEKIKKTNIVFEERVFLKCLTCQKYNQKWTCPPNIPNLNYRKAISEYDYRLLVYNKVEFNKETFIDVRRMSSRELHKNLLSLENYLWNNGFFLATSFIGGSCKFCDGDCSKNFCRYPTKSRIPIEALGINIVKTAKNIGLDIKFPVDKIFYRIGLLLW